MAASTSPTLPPEVLAPGAAALAAPKPEPAARSGVAAVWLESEASPLLDLLPPENAAYWRGFVESTPVAFAPNLNTRAGLVVHDRIAWPLTRSDRPGDNSYPCSLLTQYVRYPRAELGFVPAGLPRAATSVGLTLLGALLRGCQAERTVQWSSWLLSTNLHPPSLKAAIVPVTQSLVRAFPRHAVLVKNIHGFEDPGLPAAFVQAGYHLVTSRQIYFFDGRHPAFLGKSTVKRDAKDFAQLREYRVVEHDSFTALDVPRITDLYRQLYLEKHSDLNPRYTKRFVSRALAERWLEFRGLRHACGRLDAVLACFTQGTTTSTPFIGYDTSLPTESGLYRHLVTLLLRQVADRRQLLNYSSGAGDFKRRRGGQPVIEFNALYTRHLAPHRQAGFRLLAFIANRFVRPFLERNRV